MHTPSRKGSPPLALQTLIERLRKKTAAAEVRVNEALDAARTLQQDPRTRVARYRNAAMTGGTLNPVVRGIGRAAERMATAPRGQRLAAGAKGLLATNRGELARHVAEGVVGGGGVRAVQEGLEVGQAKKKVTKFLNQPEPKIAAKAKGGGLAHIVKAHWRRKKASLGEHLAHEVGALTGHRKLSSAEIRAAIRSVAKFAAEKKPAQSRLPLKPVASPDFDFDFEV
jgi:hypothetical protein